MGVKEVSVIRQESSGSMNLQRMNLMQRHEFVPSGFGSWKDIAFLGAVENTDLGFQVGRLLLIREGAP